MTRRIRTTRQATRARDKAWVRKYDDAVAELIWTFTMRSTRTAQAQAFLDKRAEIKGEQGSNGA